SARSRCERPGGSPRPSPRSPTRRRPSTGTRTRRRAPSSQVAAYEMCPFGCRRAPQPATICCRDGSSRSGARIPTADRSDVDASRERASNRTPTESPRRATRTASNDSRRCHLDRDAADECLIDDAVPLGEAQQPLDIHGRRVVLEIELEPDRAEADRHLLVLRDAERAAEVEIALGAHRAADVEAERRRDRTERDAGAGDERLEQEVAGAGELARAAGGGVQTGLDERAARRDGARDGADAEVAFRRQRHERARGLAPVPLLQRSLDYL